MIELHGYKGPGRALKFVVSIEGDSEQQVTRRISGVFAVLGTVYRPEFIDISLDSFLAGEFGFPEDGICVEPLTVGIAARRFVGDTSYYADQSHIGQVVWADQLTSQVIESSLVGIVGEARSLGAGRPGIARVDTPVGAARLPAQLAGRSTVGFINEDGVPRVLEVRRGWISGPDPDRIVPAPMTVQVFRNGLELTLVICVLVDAFWPADGPVMAELQPCLDQLIAAGWADPPSAG